MNPIQYLKRIEELKIEAFGFDTHARVLGIDKEEVKKLWNEATGYKFKRFPRTEYTMRTLPEFSTKLKPYWELQLPNKDYLMFYLTPTTPIIIPHGFITDKGSVPFIFRNLIAHDDREMILAYLVHDLECEMKRISRFNTDGLLYEVGIEMQANWLKRNLIYTAVRLGSWFPGGRQTEMSKNISLFNRNLITQTEKEYLHTKHTEHIDFLAEMSSNHAKI